MNKFFARLVALVLIPALLINPSFAAIGFNSSSYPVAIPEKLGSITDSYLPAQQTTKTPLLVLIQDLHGNLGVQRNIADILKVLNKRMTRQHLTVFLEGATGPFNVTSLRNVNKPWVKKETVRGFFEERKLTGAETAAIETVRPMHLWGVDDRSLYIRNLQEFYRASLVNPVPTLKHPAWKTYYSLAHLRDIPLAMNTLTHLELLQKTKSPPTLAGMVIGGYHTEGVIRVLKANEIPYVIVTPRVDSLGEEHAYVSMLQELARESRTKNLVPMQRTADRAYIEEAADEFHVEVPQRISAAADREPWSSVLWELITDFPLWVWDKIKPTPSLVANTPEGVNVGMMMEDGRRRRSGSTSPSNWLQDQRKKEIDRAIQSIPNEAARNNPEIRAFITEWFEKLGADRIEMIGPKDNDRLRAKLRDEGKYHLANDGNDYTWSHPGDTARSVDRTFVATEDLNDAGIFNNHTLASKKEAEMEAQLKGSYTDKTMYVIAGELADGLAGLEITHSEYGLTNMMIMNNIGDDAWGMIGGRTDFPRVVHATGDLDKIRRKGPGQPDDDRNFTLFPEKNLVLLYGSDYGGNMMGFKKFLELRWAQWKSYKEAQTEPDPTKHWMPMHMAVVGYEDLEGNTRYFGYVAPSQHGKTTVSTQELIPEFKKYYKNVKLVADDIVWARIDANGELWVRNPEKGSFAVLYGTGLNDNPSAMRAFTPVRPELGMKPSVVTNSAFNLKLDREFHEDKGTPHPSLRGKGRYWQNHSRQYLIDLAWEEIFKERYKADSKEFNNLMRPRSLRILRILTGVFGYRIKDIQARANKMDWSHKNSRFTTSLTNFPNYDENAKAGRAVKVEFIMGVARDRDVEPSLRIVATPDDPDGYVTAVYSLFTMRAESTAATDGPAGTPTWDPFAMKDFMSLKEGPFAQYNLDFWKRWKKGYWARYNFLRTGPDGKPLLTGPRSNFPFIDYMFRFVDGKVHGKKQVVGITPISSEMRIDGTGLTPEILDQANSVNIPRWQARNKETREFLGRFKDLPPPIWAEQSAIEARVDVAAAEMQRQGGGFAVYWPIGVGGAIWSALTGTSWAVLGDAALLVGILGIFLLPQARAMIGQVFSSAPDVGSGTGGVIGGGTPGVVISQALKNVSHLFGDKEIRHPDGRVTHVNFEKGLADITRSVEPLIADAQNARRELLESDAPAREKYAFPWMTTYKDADGNVLTFTEIVQGMIDNFLGVESPLAWRMNDDIAIPDDAFPLKNPGLEVTGPKALDMMINQINAAQDGVTAMMPDDEDASLGWYKRQDASKDQAPAAYEGMAHQKALLAGEYDTQPYVYSKKGKQKSKSIQVPRKNRPTVFNRVPGMHLRTPYITVDGKPVPQIVPSYLVHALNNYGSLTKEGSGVYHYQPKVQTPEEALIVEKIIRQVEALVGVKTGTIKIKALYEEGRGGVHLPAIMWIWRHRLIGTNVGRWDYLGSLIEMWMNEAVFPDPQTIGMVDARLFAYQRVNALWNLMVGVKNGKLTNAAPIGGMSAVMLYPMDDPQGRWRWNPKALRQMKMDKLRERLIGLIFVPNEPLSHGEQPTLRQALILESQGKGRFYDTYRQSWVATTDKDYVEAGAGPLRAALNELQELIDAPVSEVTIEGTDQKVPTVHSGLTEGEKQGWRKLGLLNERGDITPWVIDKNKMDTPEKLFSADFWGGKNLWDSLYSPPPVNEPGENDPAKGHITIERIQNAFFQDVQYGFQILNGNYAAAIDDYEAIPGDQATGFRRFMNDLATYRIYAGWLWTVFHNQAAITKGGWLKAPKLTRDGVIPGENAIEFKAGQKMTPEVFEQLWDLHNQWTQAFFADYDRRMAVKIMREVDRPVEGNEEQVAKVAEILSRAYAKGPFTSLSLSDAAHQVAGVLENAIYAQLESAIAAAAPQFDRSQAAVIMDVTKRQLLSPTYLQHSPRVLFEIMELNDEDRAERLDAIFSPSRWVVLAKVRSGVWKEETLNTYDRVHDIPPSIPAIPEPVQAEINAREQKIKDLVEWMYSPRFADTERVWTARDIAPIMGSTPRDVSFGNKMARKLRSMLQEFENNRKTGKRPNYIGTLGVANGSEVAILGDHGFRAAYVSGWQASINEWATRRTGPDLARYTYDTVPKIVDRLVRFMKDQQTHQELRRSAMTVDELAAAAPKDYELPLFADGDTGHDVWEMMELFIEAGAAAVHIEDQARSGKKCGHMPGKVLVPIQEQINRLLEARAAADTMGSEILLVSRTDSEAANMITGNQDDRDHAFILGTTRTDLPNLKTVIDLAWSGPTPKYSLRLKTNQARVEELAAKWPTLADGIKKVWALKGDVRKESPATAELSDAWAKLADLKTYREAVADVIQHSSRSNKAARLAEWNEFNDPMKHTVSHAEAVEKAKSMNVRINWDWEKARTWEGFYQIQPGVEIATVRSRTFAPYADILWMEQNSPDLEATKFWADGIRSMFPGKFLAINNSPSFNWLKRELHGERSTAEVKEWLRTYEEKLGDMGVAFHFITVGEHITWQAWDDLAKSYQDEHMLAYVRDIQAKEFAAKADHGYRAVEHQNFAGADHRAHVMDLIARGAASTKPVAHGHGQSGTAGQFTSGTVSLENDKSGSDEFYTYLPIGAASVIWGALEGTPWALVGHVALFAAIVGLLFLPQTRAMIRRNLGFSRSQTPKGPTTGQGIDASARLDGVVDAQGRVNPLFRGIIDATGLRALTQQAGAILQTREALAGGLAFAAVVIAVKTMSPVAGFAALLTTVVLGMSWISKKTTPPSQEAPSKGLLRIFTDA